MNLHQHIFVENKKIQVLFCYKSAWVMWSDESNNNGKRQLRAQVCSKYQIRGSYCSY